MEFKLIRQFKLFRRVNILQIRQSVTTPPNAIGHWALVHVDPVLLPRAHLSVALHHLLLRGPLVIAIRRDKLLTWQCV